jgi:hypothetical protein
MRWRRQGRGQCWARIHIHLAAALIRLNRLTEARTAIRDGLALDPAFTLRRLRAGALSDNPTYLAQRESIFSAMREAGAPEE